MWGVYIHGTPGFVNKRSSYLVLKSVPGMSNVGLCQIKLIAKW